MRTVKNVPILHAGVEYHLSTGDTTFTPEDLRDVVTAANEDPSIPNPRLKLGHIDPRFNDPEFDATPAFGKATNLRLSPNGMEVLADYIGVPAWLAEIMPYAYPSRSIEGYWNVQSQMGKKWKFVLSACSLLGVTWPGCTVLEDLPQYYGEEVPPDVVIDLDVVAASQHGGDPVKLTFSKKDTASANLDDVRRAFYNEYLHDHPEYDWWWIVQVLTDPNELVVEDDETGQLFKLPFSSDDTSDVSFGEAEPVRVDYIPDSRDAQKAAATHVAAMLAIERKVVASYSSRAESRPATASGGAMDGKEVRKRLNLPEDSSDEQVKEALAELNTAAGVEVTQEVPAATPATPVVETPTAEKPGEEAKPLAASALPPGMVAIDEDTLELLKTGASAGLETKRDRDKERRETLVAAAIRDGRIAPAGREKWLGYLEGADKAGDDTAKATLEGLKKGTVPVELRELGHAGTSVDGENAGDELSPETVASWSDGLFPEVREQRRRDVALAAGENVPRNRVMADASYRR